MDINAVNLKNSHPSDKLHRRLQRTNLQSAVYFCGANGPFIFVKSPPYATEALDISIDIAAMST